jgi:hypothetical protein
MKIIMAFLFFPVLFCGCNRHASTLQNQITGTWVQTNAENTVSFAPDGSFHTEISGNMSRQIVYGGQWQIEGNVLMMAITNVSGSEPHEAVGHVDYFEIAHLDGTQLVYQMETNQINVDPHYIITMTRQK